MRSAELTPIRYEALSAPGSRKGDEKRVKHDPCFNCMVSFHSFMLTPCRLQVLTFSAVGLRLFLALLLLEFHVAKMHDGSDYFIAAILLIW